MKIKLKNVGIIKNAEVEFPGITVIAGENDTGKSTIGRMIYSTITAFGQTEDDVSEAKGNKILDVVFETIFVFGRNREMLDEILEKAKPYIEAFGTNIKRVDQLMITFNGFREFFESFDVNESDLKTINKKFIELEQIIKQEESLDKHIKEFLDKILYSEFYNQINNAVYGDEANVSCFEQEQEMFSFFVSRNRLLSVNTNNKSFIFKNATLLESPVLLQFKLILDRASTTLELGDKIKRGTLSSLRAPNIIPLHVKTLDNTINNLAYIQESSENRISQSVNEIINGKFVFNRELNDFVFEKANSKSSLRTLNTANGVKAFGLIDILTRVNALNEKSLLIIDEPETNMHPEWQLKYAELLVELCKNGIKMLVTSHSPYMIQAIKYFSQKAEIFGEKTRFYLAERSRSGENWAEIKDVSTDISPIFDKLTKPFDDLINDFE